MCAFQFAISGKRSSNQFSNAFNLFIASCPLAVRTDDQPGIAQIGVRGHLQVDRRGNALEYATRQVELGAVAGTEESARPVAPHAVARTGGKLLRRRTPQ